MPSNASEGEAVVQAFGYRLLLRFEGTGIWVSGGKEKNRSASVPSMAVVAKPDLLGVLFAIFASWRFNCLLVWASTGSTDQRTNSLKKSLGRQVPGNSAQFGTVIPEQQDRREPVDPVLI